ncbi:MAG: suppressor of fused domain protein [Phycisphaerae bacterium]|nr:suppressor of fused domain protein [Phycisphaerae bacterium]
MRVHVPSLLGAVIGAAIAAAGVALLWYGFHVGYPRFFVLPSVLVFGFGAKLAYQLASESFVGDSEPPTRRRGTAGAGDEGDDSGFREWQELWNDRKDALTRILGEPEDGVFTAIVPFYLGGTADVLEFRNHIKGVVYVTGDLIGDDRQKQNELGNYELMICHREANDWGPGIISKLAKYTLDAALRPWETMDIAPAVPEGSTIAGFLFAPYKRFAVRDWPCGLLLCVGITEDELDACKAGRRKEVVKRLKEVHVLPYTDLERDSVLA